MKEVWREIKGFEGVYKISNFGRVWSRPREGTNGGLKSLIETEKGYLSVQLCFMEIIKTLRVNRLVAEHFIPNPGNKPEVNHINGNKKNNRVDNLEWVTHLENMEHAVKVIDSIPRGEKSHRTNLTDKDVLLIKEYLKDKFYSIKQIAEVFNTTQRAVSFISLGKSWKHLLKKDDNINKHRRPTRENNLHPS